MIRAQPTYVGRYSLQKDIVSNRIMHKRSKAGMKISGGKPCDRVRCYYEILLLFCAALVLT